MGREGERIAAAFLRRNGYKVLYRNFSAAHGGEVDIVCRDKRTGTLVFVEVKTRTSLDLGRPAEAVNPEKQRLISKGALAWLRMLGNPDIRYRFDIVEIVMNGNRPEITLLKDAFTLSEPYRY